MANFFVPQLVKQDVPHSRFNFTSARRSPSTVGVVTPILTEFVLPGDDWRIKDVSSMIRTLPLIAPMMGSFRVQLDWYFEPFTNLYQFMDNNTSLTTRQIVDMPLWTLSIPASACRLPSSTMGEAEIQDLYNDLWYNKPSVTNIESTSYYACGFVPDCSLMNYLGFPARSSAHTTMYRGSEAFHNDGFTFDAGYFLGYLDIYRTFYTNKQLKKGAFYGAFDDYDGNAGGTLADFIGDTVHQIDQSVLDGVFADLRRASTPFNLSSGLTSLRSQYPSLSQFMDFYKPMLLGAVGKNSNPTAESPWQVYFAKPFCGLGLAQYRPDVFRSVILPVDSTMTSTLTASFTIDALRVASHLQRLYDLYDVSGGQFSKWYEMQFDVEVSGDVDRPVLLGTSHQYITVNDVTATSLTNSSSVGQESVQVGEQFGQIQVPTGFRGIRFRSKCHGYLYAMLTIVPEVDYSDTVSPLLANTRFGSIYTPAMAQLGFEPMPAYQYAASNNGGSDYNIYTDPGKDYGNDLRFPSVMCYDFYLGKSYFDGMHSVGRNVHWYNYMTDVNRNFGAFSLGGKYESWCMNRSFARSKLVPDSESNPTYELDLNMYVVPDDWQYMFSYQESGAQSWFMQFGFDIEATRPIPKYMLGEIV